MRTANIIALAALAVLLSLAGTGCGQYYLQTPPSYPTNASDTTVAKAYRLSGGQITRFIPRPGAFNDPVDNLLLAGLPPIHVPGHIAQSVILQFNAGGYGQNEVIALIVGHETLIDVPDIMQNIGGMVSPLRKGEAIRKDGRTIIVKTSGQLPLFSNQRQPILLTPNSKIALIGTTQVTLKHPFVPISWQYRKNGQVTTVDVAGGAVMTLSDFLMLLNKRDAMLGWHTGTTISQVKIVQK